MDAAAILRRLLALGWELWTQEGLLLVRHEDKTLTPQQRQYLTQHKAALLAAVDAVLADEERAAITDAATSVDLAEAAPSAWEQGQAFLLGQHQWVTCCDKHPCMLQCLRCDAVYVRGHGIVSSPTVCDRPPR